MERIRRSCSVSGCEASTKTMATSAFSNAASVHYTLAVMTAVALVVTPVVLLDQAWTYYVLRAHRTDGRLCREPRRLWKRYTLDLIAFGGMVLWAKRARRPTSRAVDEEA